MHYNDLSQYKKWAAGAIVTVVLIVAGVMGERNNLREVTIDEIVVGYTKSEETAKNLLEEAKNLINEENGNAIRWNVELNFEQGKGRKANTDEELQNSMTEALKQLKAEQEKLAYTLKIDDYTAILESQEAAAEVLTEAQQRYSDSEATVELVKEVEKEGGYVPKINLMTKSARSQDLVAASENGSKKGSNVSAKTKGSSVVKIKFAEDIEVVETYTKPENILSVEEAVSDITKEKVQNETYTVKAGDTISGIANGNGMTVKEFMAINPEIKDADAIMPDDEVILEVPKPELSVLVQKEETHTEKYTAKTVYVKNSSMYKGESKIISKGKAGVRAVTALVSYKNGEEYKRKVTDTEVVTKAVAKKVEQGTKVRPTFIKPIDGGIFTSGFGARWGRTHEGIDWACGEGTNVKASSSGTVTQSGWMNGYGYCVTISHGEGMATRYGHMSKTAVSVGDTVSQGDLVGYSGNTGRSTGPHVHFEIHKNGTAVNPFDYL